jgi:membrane associated rhomboid family serine protease
MFFPLRDNIPSARPPYANYSLIGLNVLAFFYELSLGPQLQEFVGVLGFVPARFMSQLTQNPLGLGELFIPMFTSMFLHGGWLHIISNLWFLHIFGDNVEDALGSGRFLMLYLACGLAACFTQLLFGPSSRVPMIGASGAIAGVMGAYFFLFPRARVLTLVFIIVFVTVLEIPAYIFLGLWFFMQFLMGTATMTDAALGGVAFWAHVGGFAMGILLVHLFLPHQVRGPLHRHPRQAVDD